MGTWRAELYQDDVAEDVRDYYKNQLRKGKSGAEVTLELIDDYNCEIFDTDDAPIFWFALADTQWNLGRLEEHVKLEALRHIKDGADLRRWEEENPKLAKVRAKVHIDLEQKLQSPQPPEKKISIQRLYKCEWNVGDVFAYPLESEYAKEKRLFGKYLLLQKAFEYVWHPGHIVPIVRIRITEENTLPKSDTDINKSDYVFVNTKVQRLASKKYSTPQHRVLHEF